MEKTRRILTVVNSEFDMIIKKPALWILHILFIIIPAYFLFVLLAGETLSFERPHLAHIYPYVVLIMIAVINSIILYYREYFGFDSVDEAYKEEKYSSMTVISGRVLLFFVINICFTLSSIPLLILYYGGGGIPLSAVGRLVLATFFSGFSAAIISYYISELFDKYRLVFFLIYLDIYITGLIVTYSYTPPKAYINMIFQFVFIILAFLLIVELKLNLHSFIFKD